MKSSIMSSLVAVTILAILSGCSIDRLESLRHPENSKPGDSVIVSITNIYSHLNNGRYVTWGPVQRDSVHFLIRVPEGYEILGAKSYLIPDFTFQKLFDQLSGNTISDSILQSYTDKLVPMARNPSLDSQIKGSTFSAFNIKNRNSSVKVNTNDGKWVGYSAKIDILLKSGEKLDTIFSIDSVLAMAGRLGQDTAALKRSIAALPIPVDSIAVTSKPILIQAAFRTKSTTSLDTIYYYTKTAKLPAPSTDQSSNGEVGSMIFAELNVSNNNAAIKNFQNNRGAVDFRAFPNPFTSKIKLFAPVKGNNITISIYSIKGALVRQIIVSRNGDAEWDGTDRDGKQMQSGQYIVRINSHDATGSQVINFIR